METLQEFGFQILSLIFQNLSPCAYGDTKLVVLYANTQEEMQLFPVFWPMNAKALG